MVPNFLKAGNRNEVKLIVKVHWQVFFLSFWNAMEACFGKVWENLFDKCSIFDFKGISVDLRDSFRGNELRHQKLLTN